MTTIDPTDPAAEASPLRRPTQLPLAALRWLLIGTFALAVWAGAATMVVSAADELADVHGRWAWVAGVAATLPVALSMFNALDRLVEAPVPSEDPRRRFASLEEE